ncbi:putative Pentatricopeptide repeat domain containing protein [Klebsormidium nitens]|uniref:Putative Pentatricopeptide repeat domain containing protein n=1 Tax=Klebsormidium nitens TaxID=105231 RepID=A0A1Y1I845_KLENI|nr:putative Pentatricopeptide repeat domain containing protein [Klebsormidium nitens]|eukprot:GAQ84278.1 putative Pentatricopeptide repeat domain containing protein [Klebsormidium nitens]
MDPGSTTADSITERLEVLEAGPTVDDRFQRGVWDNLAPQGAKARLVDKALTRLMRETDETRALAYLDHWEGSLDPKCVLQLIQEIGERKALTKLQPVLEWCRKQQWAPQELTSAYRVVIKTAEALSKADVVVQLFEQMQDSDHLTPPTEMYVSLVQARTKIGDYQKAYDAILKLVELGHDIGQGDDSLLGALLFRVSSSPLGGTTAVALLRRALADGLAIDTRMVTSVLIGLQKEVPADLAEVTADVTAAVKAKGVKLDQFAYRVLLTTYQRTEALSELRDVLHELEDEEGLEPNMDYYRFLIPKLSAEERAEEAFAETRRLREKGAAIDGWIFRSCMYGCCRSGLCDQAAELYQDFRRTGFEPTLTQLNYLMGAFTKAGRKAEALGFYEELLEADLRPNAVTYGTLMDMARPDLPKVRAWFEQMKEDGVEPDRAVYHLMIDTLATNGQVDEARALLKEMEHELAGVSGGLKATPYVALAAGFAAVDRWEEAVDTLMRMRGRGMVVTTQTLVGVFQAASQNSGATVSMLLQIAERKGLPLSPTALTEIAGLFRRQGAVGAAWEVARKLKAQEPALDRRSFVEILNIHSRKGEWVDAQITFDKMVKAGIKPHPNDWTSLMAAYGKGVEYDKAVAILEQLIASGERPDTTKYNVLIDACIRAERPGEVTRWLAAMKERRVPFDSITFNMVIGAYAGRGDVRATEFTYRKMLENGHTPTKETYHYLIRASIAGGQFEAAPAWLEEMRKRGIERDVFTYNTLIRGYTERHRTEELEVVVGDMLQAAVPPDHITYELLFDYPDEGDRLARVLFASVKRVMSREAVEEQYNKLLMALTRKRRWDEVELVVDQAHEEGCRLDKRTFEGAIEKMAVDKKVTMAINMFHRMRAAMPHVVPREFAFMPVLHSFGRRRQWKQAAELLVQLKQAGVPCRAASHHKVLSIMEASEQWAAIVELYKSIRGEEFVRADKGILQLVMRAAKARVKQQQPDLELLQELYHALRGVRALPEKPPRVDSQHIQVRKLWKRGMKVARGVGIRDPDASGAKWGAAGEKGSDSRETEGGGNENEAKEPVAETGGEGGPSEGRGTLGRQSEGCPDDRRVESGSSSGKKEITNGSIELNERGEKNLGRTVENVEMSRAKVDEPSTSAVASGVERTQAGDGHASLKGPQNDVKASQTSVHREDSDINGTLVADKADARGISEASNERASLDESESIEDRRVAKLEDEDRMLEVLERSARQDEVLEGVVDSLN